jgi:WD40 repeat protein
VESGREVGTFRGHEDGVSCVQFLPNGGLVSCGHDGTLRVWDATPPGVVAYREWAQSITAVATDGEGRVIALTQPGTQTVRLLRLDKGKPARVIDGVATHVAVSPDATVVAGPTPADLRLLEQGRCGTQLWDAVTGGETRFIPGVVGPVAFTVDGRSVVGIRARVVNKSPLNLAGDLERNELVVCDRDTGEERFRLAGHTAAVRCVAVLPGGKRLASADGEEVFVWDLESRTVLHRFKVTHRWHVGAMAWRPDGKQLATAGTIDRTVVVRDAATGTERYALTLAGRATALAYSPDSRLLVAGCDDGTVRVWDAESGQSLLTLTDAHQPVRCLTFAGPTRLIAGGGGSSPAGELLIWRDP